MQEAPPDSAAVAADSLAADTVLIDTSAAAADVIRGVGEASDRLLEGDYETAAEILIRALWDFLLEGLVPALLVAFGFWVLYRVIRGVLGGALQRSRRVDAGVQQLIMRAVRLAVVSFAAVTVLGTLGINVTALVAGLGIAGIALGFAAQDTIQNLIAGVTILLDRPFIVGDNIELEDTFGTVQEITLRSTRIRTLDNQMAILPNSKVISEKIINHSMHRALRVVVRFGIAYKENPTEARRVVLALAEGDERLHPDFPPTAVVTELGDSSVNMELRLHLKDPQLEVPVRFEYQEKVFDALKAAGIEIPFPHLQLFIDEAKAFEGTRLLAPPDRPSGDGA